MATNADRAGSLFALPAIAAVDTDEPGADGSLLLRSTEPLGDYPVTVVHSLRGWAQADPDACWSPSAVRTVHGWAAGTGRR